MATSKSERDRATFLEFSRYLRTRYPPEICIAVVMDTSAPPIDHERHEGGRPGPGQQRRAGLCVHQRQLVNHTEARFQALRNVA